jgi:ABC-2 type transport system permease protein
MAVFFLFFTVQFGVLGYLEERRDGTLARLLASPIRAIDVIAAKVVVSLIVGIVSVSACSCWPSPDGCCVGEPPGRRAAGGRRRDCRHHDRGCGVGRGPNRRAGQRLPVHPGRGAGHAGRLVLHLDAAPAWLRNLSGLTPHGSFLDGLRVSARGGGVADVIGPLVTMLAFGAVVLGITALLVRREAAR